MGIFACHEDTLLTIYALSYARLYSKGSEAARQRIFLSESASVKKAAIKKLMNMEDGDDFWFPCSVHFCQLAMKEVLRQFSSGRNVGDDVDKIDWAVLEEEKLLGQIDLLST